MTAPYSSTLLHEAPAHRGAPPLLPPAPMPQPAWRQAAPVPYAWHPQQVVAVPRSGSSRSEMALLLVLIVVLVAVLAVAGYAVARQQAPSPAEMARYQDLARRSGFDQGQQQGISAGREQAIAHERRIAELKAQIERQKQWNRGYREGRRVGRNSTRPVRSTGYYGPAAPAPRRSARPARNADVQAALAAAQRHANITGAPVDVEIYP